MRRTKPAADCRAGLEMVYGLAPIDRMYLLLRANRRFVKTFSRPVY
jgi:hypothetical protein